MHDESPGLLKWFCAAAVLAAIGMCATWEWPKPVTHEQQVDAWLDLPTCMRGKFPGND